MTFKHHLQGIPLTPIMDFQLTVNHLLEEGDFLPPFISVMFRGDWFGLLILSLRSTTFKEQFSVWERKTISQDMVFLNGEALHHESRQAPWEKSGAPVHHVCWGPITSQFTLFPQILLTFFEGWGELTLDPCTILFPLPPISPDPRKWRSGNQMSRRKSPQTLFCLRQAAPPWNISLGHYWLVRKQEVVLAVRRGGGG